MDVSKRITYFRNQRNITINKLANNAGVSQSYLREVEMGTKKPTVSILSELCDALGVTLKDFFDETPEPAVSDEELMNVVGKLSPDQKRKLLDFIKSMS